MKRSVFFYIGAAMAVISCSGNVKPSAYGIIDADKWMVASSEQGQIVSLNVTEGKKLLKDEKVGLIDTAQLSIQLKAVEAQVVSLRQTLPDIGKQMDVLHQKKESVRNEIARIRPLAESGSVSTKQLERLEEELRLCESQESASRSSLSRESASVLASIIALEAQADVLKDKISRSVIVNPENGTVSELYVKEHEFVSSGMPVYKLSDYENMFVDCWFDAQSLASVTLGSIVDVVPDSADRHRIDGTVIYIAEESEFTPNKVMTRDTRERYVYRVRVSIHNDGTLKAGMPAEIFLRESK